MGTGGFLLEVKWLGRDVDQSHLSVAEVTNQWSYTPTPPYTFTEGRGTVLALSPSQIKRQFLYAVLTEGRLRSGSEEKCEPKRGDTKRKMEKLPSSVTNLLLHEILE
jgi:hypothetical protein